MADRLGEIRRLSSRKVTLWIVYLRKHDGREVLAEIDHDAAGIAALEAAGMPGPPPGEILRFAQDDDFACVAGAESLSSNAG